MGRPLLLLRQPIIHNPGTFFLTEGVQPSLIAEEAVPVAPTQQVQRVRQEACRW
jgi:hypothetical protein